MWLGTLGTTHYLVGWVRISVVGFGFWLASSLNLTFSIMLEV
jgi:hypothetical protein